MTSLSWEDDGAQEGLLTRRSAEKCLSDKEIEDFLGDRLSGVTREVVEEHLLVCPRCLDCVEQEEEFAGLVRAAVVGVEPPEPDPDVGSPGPRGGWRDRLRGWFSRPWVRSGGILITASASVALLLVSAPWRHASQAGQEILLTVERGAAPAALTVRAAVPVVLKASVEELVSLPAYRMEVVNGSGKLVATGTVAPVRGQVSWKVDGGLRAGQYWVRLKDPGQPEGLLREFGVLVQ